MIDRFLGRVAAGALLLLGCGPLYCQQFTPKSIAFQGDARYSQARLVAASGLHPGSPITPQEMQAVTQRLIDTGLFATVRWSFDGAVLRFALAPAEAKLEPVQYLNFPWWSADELNQAVAARIPLFDGRIVPESGLQQQVVDALTALLAAKGVQAKVEAAPGKDLSGQDSGVGFEITSPKVTVGDVTLSGADPQRTADLPKVQKAASGQPWNSATQQQIQQALNAVYHRQGFLDETISSFAHGEPQASGDSILVPLQVSVVEGAQYRFAGITLTGDSLVSSAEFQKSAPLHPGDLANEDLLRAMLLSVAHPYRSQGYLDAKISATPSFDRTQHTVAYTVSIAPGPVYHFHKLTLVNLDDTRTAAVLQRWKLQPGDAFDAYYAPQFLVSNKSLHELDGWSAAWKQLDNTVTHSVDLVLTFTQGGPLQ